MLALKKSFINTALATLISVSPANAEDLSEKDFIGLNDNEFYLKFNKIGCSPDGKIGALITVAWKEDGNISGHTDHYRTFERLANSFKDTAKEILPGMETPSQERLKAIWDEAVNTLKQGSAFCSKERIASFQTSSRIVLG